MRSGGGRLTEVETRVRTHRLAAWTSETGRAGSPVISEQTHSAAAKQVKGGETEKPQGAAPDGRGWPEFPGRRALAGAERATAKEGARSEVTRRAGSWPCPRLGAAGFAGPGGEDVQRGIARTARENKCFCFPLC